MSFVTNNHEENFRTDDPDCCVSFIFGWGKSVAARTTRKFLLQGLNMKNRITRAEWAAALKKEWEIAVDSYPKDMPRIKAIEYLMKPERNDNLEAPTDFSLTQSMRVLMTRREDLWLKHTDCSWHLPILITLREWPFRNWRKRTRQAETKRIETSRSYLRARRRELSSGPEVSRERSGWDSSNDWHSQEWQQRPWTSSYHSWEDDQQWSWQGRSWTGASSSASNPHPQGGSEWSSAADQWL